VSGLNPSPASRGGNSSAGNLPITKHGLFGLPGVTKIQNKIVAAAARIGITCGFKPVISRKAHCSSICPSRREILKPPRNTVCGPKPRDI
jgi:hypothetical protein